MSDAEVSNLITVQQARRIIDSAPIKRRTAREKLGKYPDCYLAEDVLADRDSPPFDKSLMDGYAVRAADVQKIPCELAIAGTVAAGESAISALRPGYAMAIMTGAPLPAGADAVVPVEATKVVDGTHRVAFAELAVAGRHIARRGYETAAGSVVLNAGTRLGPPQIAVAASVGAVDVAVFSPPSVGVLGTGDELVWPEMTPTGSQIRSCNNAMLMALLGRFPCRPFDVGMAPDQPAAIEEKIRIGLSHDMLLITGGMSMGERDFVPGILKRLGANLKITKLRIKPGKPFVFAEMRDGTFVFGLPGNPVSAFVCTLVLVSRLIRRMAGASPDMKTLLAPLAASLEANGPREFYQPAVFDSRQLTPLQWKGSADIFTLSRANALLIRPENQPPQPAGAAIEFIDL